MGSSQDQPGDTGDSGESAAHLQPGVIMNPKVKKAIDAFRSLTENWTKPIPKYLIKSKLFFKELKKVQKKEIK